MWQPSYDFDIFDIPFFSQLQAQEFGAATSFQASDPTSWVDYSIGRLMGVLQPDNPAPYRQRQFPAAMQDYGPFGFFQGGQTRAEIEAEVEQRRLEVEKARQAASNPPGGCPAGYSPVSVFGIFSYCGKDLKSGGPAPESGQKVVDKTKDFFKDLPKGSGTFLIAIAALIFILLFVKR